ncbi:MAG: sigma-70 family RNA polymerase sigma factor [Nitrospinota bacterium]|nr:MAG: sigma-70 family RNA polymerase sigma factor [Nitrospinota bacterium]
MNAQNTGDRGAREERQLVAQAKAGDYRAFEQLVQRHEGRLYALAMHMVRQREDAEDVVRTTFLNVIEHLATFREEASFATWVTRIAINNALKVLRKRRPGHFSLEEASLEETEGDIPHPEYIADWRGDPASLLEQQELRRVLEETIATLPEKLRLVFILRDVRGLSIRETADLLGISEANVKVRLLRARLLLREKLTRIFGEEKRRLSPHHDTSFHPSTMEAVAPGKEAGSRGRT